jgi:hypothetical protein
MIEYRVKAGQSPAGCRFVAGRRLIVCRASLRVTRPAGLADLEMASRHGLAAGEIPRQIYGWTLVGNLVPLLVFV